MASVIDIMIDRADMRCTVCGTPSRTGCSCWTKCRCGWSFRADREICRNPAHYGPRTVMMRCPSCRATKMATNHETDPGNAVVIVACCEACQTAPWPDVVYLDVDGKQIKDGTK